MFMYKGIKIVAVTEPVIGKVVEYSNEEFRIREYYVNEYKTYDSREICTFEVILKGKDQENISEWDTFLKELGKYGMLNEFFVEVSVLEFIKAMG